MHKPVLFLALMLLSRLLAGQPDRSAAVLRGNDNFNRLIVAEIKAGHFSSIYQHLKPGFDTVKLGQTFSRYAPQVIQPGYKVVSLCHGWTGTEPLFLAMYTNTWSMYGDEKFSIEVWFYKKDDRYIIDRLNFQTEMKELYSPEAAAADSLNKIVLRSIAGDNYMAIYNLFKPGVKIDKKQLAKTVRAFCKIVADTSLAYRHPGLKMEHFPLYDTHWDVDNYWEHAPYKIAAGINVQVVAVNGKYYVAEIKFLSADKNVENLAFPGGKIYFDQEVPPPPPPFLLPR